MPPAIARRSQFDLHTVRLIPTVYFDLIITGGEHEKKPGEFPAFIDHDFYFLTKLVTSCMTVYADPETRVKVLLSILLLGARGAAHPKVRKVRRQPPREVRFEKDIRQLGLLLQRLTNTLYPTDATGIGVALFRNWIIAFAGDLRHIDRGGLQQICREVKLARARRLDHWSTSVLGALLVCLAGNGTAPDLWKTVAEHFLELQIHDGSTLPPTIQSLFPLTAVFARYVNPEVLTTLGVHRIGVFRTILALPDLRKKLLLKFPLSAVSAMMEGFKADELSDDDIAGYFNALRVFLGTPPKEDDRPPRMTPALLFGLEALVRLKGAHRLPAQGLSDLTIPIIEMVRRKPARNFIVTNYFKLVYGKETDEEAMRAVAEEVQGNDMREKFLEEAARKPLGDPERAMKPEEFEWICAFVKCNPKMTFVDRVRTLVREVLAHPNHPCFNRAAEMMRDYL
jgi:hypothetical protein